MYKGIVNCKWHKTLQKISNTTKYKILNTREFYKKNVYFVCWLWYFLKDVLKNESILHAAHYWDHSMYLEILSTVKNWKLTGSGPSDMAWYCVCPAMVHTTLSSTLTPSEPHSHIFKEHFIFFILHEEVILQIHNTGSTLEHIKWYQ